MEDPRRELLDRLTVLAIAYRRDESLYGALAVIHALCAAMCDGSEEQLAYYLEPFMAAMAIRTMAAGAENN
jgi:hypothetical protein